MILQENDHGFRRMTVFINEQIAKSILYDEAIKSKIVSLSFSHKLKTSFLESISLFSNEQNVAKGKSINSGVLVIYFCLFLTTVDERSHSPVCVLMRR